MNVSETDCSETENSYCLRSTCSRRITNKQVVVASKVNPWLLDSAFLQASPQADQSKVVSILDTDTPKQLHLRI